ncbi:hypothetical protein Nmel_002889, partial [Mimus melanotis]
RSVLVCFWCWEPRRVLQLTQGKSIQCSPSHTVSSSVCHPCARPSWE